MLDSRGFDLWAGGYDESVGLSEREESYPFAGYQDVLGHIYQTIRSGAGKRVLDVGVGTGVLAGRLYEDGYAISALDFSPKMLALAGERLPEARLLQWDFADGLPPEWAEERFDFIVCTYAIHHLDAGRKGKLIRELMDHLEPGGKVLIGDVAFETAADREACRRRAGEEWDEEEFYLTAEELRRDFPEAEFEKIGPCAGVVTLERPGRA